MRIRQNNAMLVKLKAWLGKDVKVKSAVCSGIAAVCAVALAVGAATYAASLGLKVNAGHGLTYHNVKAIAALPEMHELNIGHAIIGRAVMSGLKEAVAEMKRLMLEARG